MINQAVFSNGVDFSKFDELAKHQLEQVSGGHSVAYTTGYYVGKVVQVGLAVAPLVL